MVAFIGVIIVTLLIIQGFRMAFGNVSLLVTIPLSIWIIFFIRDASGNTMYTACRDAKKHQAELLAKYRIPFKIKVYYQNGDTEILNIKPLHTWGKLDPVDIYITQGSNGRELKSQWTLEVNGTRIPYGDSIATGIRRFEKI